MSTATRPRTVRIISDGVSRGQDLHLAPNERIVAVTWAETRDAMGEFNVLIERTITDGDGTLGSP